MAASCGELDLPVTFDVAFRRDSSAAVGKGLRGGAGVDRPGSVNPI